MEHIRTCIRTGLLMMIVVVMGAGVTVSTAEAAFGNPDAQHIQIRTRDLSHQNNQHMLQLLTQLRDRLHQLVRLQMHLEGDSAEIQIVTRQATQIETDEALLRGRVVDFNSSNYADVWFVYGTDRNDLDFKTSSRRIDEDEDSYFDRRITHLKDDTKYYFQAVGKDDEGQREYGSIVVFRTDVDRQDNKPDVTTRSATDISDDRAELRGTVDMNDFRNGEVFFVYGEDEDQVEDVEDDFDSYDDVDEDNEELQKVRVDTDLDDDDSYEKQVKNVDDNTKHYFSMCVGYEDEDDDEVLVCGSVRTFITD